VSLSTTPQNQVGTLQRVIDALGAIRVRGLVTTGPAVDPGSLRVPGNVAVRHSAPHTVVFQQGSLVVTHAGHGTVIRALAAGVPLLGLPMGRDQPDVAARVVHRGAGLRLSPKRSAAAIAAAVQRLLQEPGFVQAARLLSGAIAEECRHNLAILELERLGSPSAAPGAPSMLP
jgi:UDP:flavonoid glycosyltransferase YjiC (YdhE family)